MAHAVDPRFVAGYRPSTGRPPASTIERTSDGGLSWQTLWRRSGTALSHLTTVGQEVIATGVASPPGGAPEARPETPVLVSTNDAGATWKVTLPVAPPPSGPDATWYTMRFDFATSSTGFAVADPMAQSPTRVGILRTVDADGHWSPVTLPGGAPNGGIAFVDPLHGFATGDAYGVTGSADDCELWATSDGGATWAPMMRGDATAWTQPHSPGVSPTP